MDNSYFTGCSIDFRQATYNNVVDAYFYSAYVPDAVLSTLCILIYQILKTAL